MRYVHCIMSTSDPWLIYVPLISLGLNEKDKHSHSFGYIETYVCLILFGSFPTSWAPVNFCQQYNYA